MTTLNDVRIEMLNFVAENNKKPTKIFISIVDFTYITKALQKQYGFLIVADAHTKVPNKLFGLEVYRVIEENVLKLFANMPKDLSMFDIKRLEADILAMNLEVENLTKQQTCEAFKQALFAGDFHRHVHVDNNAQCITYIPYRRCEELESEVKALKYLLRQMLYYRDPIGKKFEEYMDNDLVIACKIVIGDLKDYS